MHMHLHDVSCQASHTNAEMVIYLEDLLLQKQGATVVRSTHATAMLLFLQHHTLQE